MEFLEKEPLCARCGLALKGSGFNYDFPPIAYSCFWSRDGIVFESQNACLVARCGAWSSIRVWTIMGGAVGTSAVLSCAWQWLWLGFPPKQVAFRDGACVRVCIKCWVCEPRNHPKRTRNIPLHSCWALSVTWHKEPPLSTLQNPLEQKAASQKSSELPTFFVRSPFFHSTAIFRAVWLPYFVTPVWPVQAGGKEGAFCYS